MSHRVAAGTIVFAVALIALVSAQQKPAAPVDDAALRSVESRNQDWLSYGRDYDEQRFSPLEQINDSNVSQLGLAWQFETATERGLEATPLVVDGVMYATGSWSVTYAIDARSGKQLWKYDPEVHRKYDSIACCDVVNRGVAVCEGKVYRRRARRPADRARRHDRQGRVADDHGRSGAAATRSPARRASSRARSSSATAAPSSACAATSRPTTRRPASWRGASTPCPAIRRSRKNPRRSRPPLPTWKGDEWWKHGGGGTVWDSMAYDPELDLLYVGTGNGSPWNRHVSAAPAAATISSCRRSSRSIPTPASYVWHYQTTPGDTWDYTATQPMMLADLQIGGRARKVLMQAPKNGFFYVIDRATGELLSAEKYVEVNWATQST